MKKILAPIFIVGMLFAQAQTQETASKDWFHQGVETNKVYGVNTEKAYEFLQKTQRKPKKIVVGVLDSGVDAEHEDLKEVMWINAKEVAGNGLDDDKNGYVDDVHGWNFLGNAKGENVNADNLEIARLYKKYQSLFKDVDATTLEKNKVQYAKEYETYLKADSLITEKTKRSKEIIEQYPFALTIYPKVFSNLQAISGDVVTADVVQSKLKPAAQSPVEQNAVEMIEQAVKNSPEKEIKISELSEGVQKEIQGAIDYAESQLNNYNPDLDTRKIVGDNYEDKTEKFYGNGNVEGPDASHGTHVAGLIAAKQDNGIGIDGVSNAAVIMGVRVVPDGDERDKDVANGIYYAVDNGAKILNMSFGKAYSPEKELVFKAIQYAEKKGVLIMHAAGNDGENIDIKTHYPTVHNEGKLISNNVITVGASSPFTDENLPAFFSNYGKKTVDIFSPGVSIYSTVPDNKYDTYNGTSMATPIAAGVAALVWSYYPELKMSDLKNILLQSVNVYDKEVKEPSKENRKPTEEGAEEKATMVNFKELSGTGGIIDAYKAVQLADAFVKKNAATSKTKKK